MNTGLQFIEQIRALRIRMADPVAEAQSEVDRVLNGGGGWLAQQFESSMAAIGAGYHTQHNPDDTHKTITATGSITERGRTLPMGVWQPVPITATTFAQTSTMTVTIPSFTSTDAFDYMLIGKTLFLSILISNLTIGGTPVVTLQVDIPGGFVANRPAWNFLEVRDNGTYRSGAIAIAQRGDSRIGMALLGATWALSAANTDIHGQFSFEIQ